MLDEAPEVQAALKPARDLIEAGFLDDARALLRQCLADETRKWWQRNYLIGLAEVERAAGRYDEMLRHARAAGTISPNKHTRVLLREARVMAELGRELLPALAALDEPSAYLGAGKLYKLDGQPERALIVYHAGLRTFRDDTYLLNGAGGALRKLDQPAAAAGAARTSLQVDDGLGSNSAAWVLLGHALCDCGRWQEAGDIAERVLAVVPDEPYATSFWFGRHSVSIATRGSTLRLRPSVAASTPTGSGSG